MVQSFWAKFDKIFYFIFLTMSIFLGNLIYAFGLKWEELFVDTPKMNYLDRYWKTPGFPKNFALIEFLQCHRL